MKRGLLRLGAFLWAAALAFSAQSQDNQPPGSAARAGGDDVKVVTLSIVGDREQPTVLYIVPWKRSPRDPVMLSPLPALAPVMERVDPAVLAHERQYETHLRKMQDGSLRP